MGRTKKINIRENDKYDKEDPMCIDIFEMRETQMRQKNIRLNNERKLF